MTYQRLAGLLAAAVFSVGSAHAATTISFSSFAFTPTAPEMVVTDFETGPGGTLADVLFSMSGYALSGDARLITGSTASSAAPAISPTAHDTTQYLSLDTGQTADLKTPLLSTISFYVGSLDGFNGLTFTHEDGTTETFMGAAIDSLLTTVDADGNQSAANANGRLFFTFSNPITGVVLTSAAPAFEISNIATTMATVPEPGSWALMIVGLGGTGGLMRRRRAGGMAAI